MPLQLEPKQCPLCINKKNFLFIKDYNALPQSFSLFECLNCHIQFWTPLKNPGSEWYLKENCYSLRAFDNYRINRAYHKIFLKRWEKKFNGKKILDLGCGTAALLSAVEQRGGQVWGVDFDKDGVEVAKEKFHLENIFQASFEDFFQRQDISMFDIVVFFEVLMHLDNPFSFLEQAVKLLKPGGTMIFSVPSRERMWANSNRWDFPPHHFTLWNHQSIKKISEKIGLKIQFFIYVEQYKILRESAVDRFRFGLVNTALKKTSDFESKSEYSQLVMALYYLGKTKEHLLGTIPAFLGWIWGKILHRNNGIIYVELIKNDE